MKKASSVGLDESSVLEEREPNVEAVSEAVVDAFDALPRDFKEQWRAMHDMSPGQLIERVHEDFEDRPAERRDLLTAYLAIRLGYRGLFRRKNVVTTEPLWDLLHRQPFEDLGEHELEILWMIACSSRKIRSNLHPKAALAAIAIWRHGPKPLRTDAALLLNTRGLPTHNRLIYELMRELGHRKSEREVEEDRRLIELARMQLQSGFCETAALMGGFFLVRRFDHWYVGPPRPNLIRACDRAAQSAPRQFRPWIDLLADAAMNGELRAAWLERPVEAAIRMSLDDLERERRLRAFHRRKLYEAKRSRLRDIYDPWLRFFEESRPPRHHSPPGRRLLDHVVETAAENPARATILLELVIEAELPPGYTLHRFLSVVDTLDPTLEFLASLYVRCLTLEPHAIRLVHRHHADIDWSTYHRIEDEDVETYLIVSDYDRGFTGLDARISGTQVSHADKHAAAWVKYFRRDRADPNTLTTIVRDFEAPAEWMATALGESRMVDHAFERALVEFETRSRQPDLRSWVIEDYQQRGIGVSSFADISSLPISKIEMMLPRERHRHLLLGAVTGAAAGALAPASHGLTSILDAPFLMSIVAEICNEFSFYYGFDPMEHPDLPLVILGVSLSGADVRPEDADTVRRDLQSFVVRKALIMAAVAQGALGQVLGPTVGHVLRAYGHRPWRSMLWDLIRRGHGDENFKTRWMRRFASFGLPVVDAFIGAALNVALVYDLCESAQAVLTDRFLERKYSSWDACY